MAGREERMRQVIKPVWVGASIIIDIGHYLAGRRMQPDVASVTEAAILNAYHSEAVLACDSRRTVCRAVIHDNNFEAGVTQFE
jgi:hypothetical protein